MARKLRNTYNKIWLYVGGMMFFALLIYSYQGIYLPSTARAADVSANVVLFLHGIGAGGDNPNPTSGGNTTPMHPSRTITIDVVNSQDQVVSTNQGTIVYNTTDKNFQGSVNFANISPGNYLLKIKSDGFLAKQLPGIQTFGSSNLTFPSIYLVTGDITNDNKLDLLDYNALISCFDVKFNTCNIPLADINDDGKVDGIDYNLLIRELSVQSGDTIGRNGVPQPSANPTLVPTGIITPMPTESSSLQPAISFARPGGGPWRMAFHDEFDGSGGTTFDAMSGANFINKTVGGGSLTGNPGLNPRKWNMGWHTGPDTLDGLGMVTTPTTGMCPNGCTENDWYGADSLIFPGDGALHMRSQQKTGTVLNPEKNTTSTSNNEEGMITTAGLLALNPANNSHGNVSADRFVDGPLILEWKATNTFVVDWPAFWMTNSGNFGHAGNLWPGGTSYQEEIDLLEPIFRLHMASEFSSGLTDIPPGWDSNDTLTFTWFFDTNRMILWVTDKTGKQIQQFALPNGQVTSSMIAAQWRLPQYFLIHQKTTKTTANYGDMTLDYVRIWN